MKWSREGVHPLLQIRASYASNDWSNFGAQYVFHAMTKKAAQITTKIQIPSDIFILAKSCQKVDDVYSRLGTGDLSIFNPIDRLS